MILGYLLALLSAVGSGSGSVIESTAIRRAGAFGGGKGDLLGKIAHQPLYWVGVIIDIGGFVCAAFALRHLPLFLVQSVLACSVGVTAIISAALGMRMVRAGWIALGGAALGLLLVGISAQPGPGLALPPVWRWILLATAGVVALIGRYGDRVPIHRMRVAAVSFGAGLGFAAVAVSARTLPPPASFVDLLGEQAAWAVAANGVIATAVFARALQLGSATAVSAVMFTTNTVLPSAIGLTLLDDRIRSGFLGWGIAGFVLAVGGAVAVAHFSAAAGDRDTAGAIPVSATTP